MRPWVSAQQVVGFLGRADVSGDPQSCGRYVTPIRGCSVYVCGINRTRLWVALRMVLLWRLVSAKPREKGDKVTKKTILWAVIVLVAFVSGFWAGASTWEYDAYDYATDLIGTDLMGTREVQ